MNDIFTVVPWGFNWNSIVATPGFSAEADNLHEMLQKEHRVNMTGCIGSGKTTLAFHMCKRHGIAKVLRIAASDDDLKQHIVDEWHACTVTHEQLDEVRYNIDAIPKPSWEEVLWRMNDEFSVPGSLIIMDLNDADAISVTLPEKANVLVISRTPIGDLPVFKKKEKSDSELLARVFAQATSDQRDADEWNRALDSARHLIKILASNVLLVEQIGRIMGNAAPDTIFKNGTKEVDTPYILRKLQKEERIGITQWDRNPTEDKTCSTALKTLGII